MRETAILYSYFRGADWDLASELEEVKSNLGKII